MGGRPARIAVGGLLLAAVALASSAGAQPTGCVPGRLTPPASEGPFYKDGSPRRTSLVDPGLPGTSLLLSGRAFGRTCRPIAGAWMDFWQADARGTYDLAGYRLRAHQLTDGEGRYRLQTVVPGGYGARTPHIHVKVRVPGGPVLTTQLYFPRESRNQQDPLFRPDLEVSLREWSTGLVGTFDFVLDAD